MRPHGLTIEVLDAFGAVAGRAVVEWDKSLEGNAAAIDEVHRVFADLPVRVPLPAQLNDPRMVWSLSCRPA